MNRCGTCGAELHIRILYDTNMKLPCLMLNLHFLVFILSGNEKKFDLPLEISFFFCWGQLGSTPLTLTKIHAFVWGEGGGRDREKSSLHFLDRLSPAVLCADLSST